MNLEISTLARKLKELFPEAVVFKGLSQRQEVSRLPRFLSEYLLMHFCGEDPSPEDLSRVSEFVRTHYPEPRDKDKVLHDLMTNGSYKLIDEFKVETDISLGTHVVSIPSLNLRNAWIFSSVLEEYENLLRSGMWGLATLKYYPRQPGESDLLSPVVLEEFVPFQAPRVDLARLREKRKFFSTQEWIEVLLHTIGLTPAAYDQRERMVLLSRLIPLVESNCNLMELGPRATGKTYFYRNVSFYTRIISGGKVSPAVLFYNIATKRAGEIAMRDCVVFDEISRVSFVNPDEMMGKMKDYMVDGFFERGPKRGHSTCSLVFMGNVDVRGKVPTEDLAEAIPPFMRDSAFVDRIHGLLPGWELPKIMRTELNLSQDHGLATDYFCEILHELRKVDFQHYISRSCTLSDEATIRDEKAIKKLASGMLKILCPHGEFSLEDLCLVLDLAIEYRQRVADWLHTIAPGEFKEKQLSYELR